VEKFENITYFRYFFGNIWQAWKKMSYFEQIDLIHAMKTTANFALPIPPIRYTKVLQLKGDKSYAWPNQFLTHSFLTEPNWTNIAKIMIHPATQTVVCRFKG